MRRTRRKSCRCFSRSASRPCANSRGRSSNATNRDFWPASAIPSRTRTPPAVPPRAGLRLLDQLKDLGRKAPPQTSAGTESFVAFTPGKPSSRRRTRRSRWSARRETSALRLEDLAVPGQLICTEDTHRLFRGRFRCARVWASKKIKGAAQLRPAFPCRRNRLRRAV